MFSKQGLMDKKQRKMEFWKGRQKEHQKQNRIGRKKDFKDRPFGGKIEKKTLKLQENSLFGPLYKQKHKNTEKQKHQKTKNRPNKHLCAFWQTTPYFWSIIVCFVQVTLFHVCKAVFRWKHYKNSVFSRAQLLGITDSKAPFEAPSQNGTFATKSAIWGFPLCLLKPLFL